MVPDMDCDGEDAMNHESADRTDHDAEGVKEIDHDGKDIDCINHDGYRILLIGIGINLPSQFIPLVVLAHLGVYPSSQQSNLHRDRF